MRLDLSSARAIDFYAKKKEEYMYEPNRFYQPIYNYTGIGTIPTTVIATNTITYGDISDIIWENQGSYYTNGIYTNTILDLR
jgi:hypothetical protein